jgi:hypothetical protein
LGGVFNITFQKFDALGIASTAIFTCNFWKVGEQVQQFCFDQALLDLCSESLPRPQI